MGRFTQDGVIYEEVGNGQVRVVGYEDAPAAPAPAPNGGVTIGQPRAQPVPSGFQRNPDGSVTYIPGGPADPSVIARNSAAGRAPQQPDQPNPGVGYMMDGGRAVPIPGGPADTAAQGNPDQASGIRTDALDKIALARRLIARSRGEWFGTGFLAPTMSNFSGTPAADIVADVDTLRAGGAINEVMRLASTNGGKNPLTPLSNADMQMLGNSLSNLDTGQSDEQFQRNVQSIINLYERAYMASGGTPQTYAQELAGRLTPEEKQDQINALVRRNASPDEIRAASQTFFGQNNADLNQWLQRYQNGDRNPVTVIGASAASAPPPNGPNDGNSPQTPDGQGGFQTYVRNAANMATAGFGNKIVSGLNTVLPLDRLGGRPVQSIWDGSSIPDAFRHNLALETATDANNARNNPGAALAGDVTGGVMAAIGAARALPAVASAGTFAPAAMGMDAAYGASVSGNQAYDNGQSVIPAALAGAGIGLAGGAVGRGVIAPTLGALVATRPGQAVANGALAAANAPRNAVRGMFGRSPVAAPRMAPPPNVTPQQAMMARNISDPAQAGRMLSEAQGLGLPMSLADTSPSMRRLAGAAFRRSGDDVRNAADATVRGRSLGQADRALGQIESNFGPIANPNRVSEDLLTQARTAAAPLYDAFRSEPARTSQTLQQILNTGEGHAALNRAYRLADTERSDPLAMGFDLDQQGNVVLTRDPSPSTLDYVKRGFDDTLSGYRDPTSGRLNLDDQGRAVEGLRQAFVSEMDRLYPNTYPAARAAYAGPASEREALGMGRNALLQQPRDIADTMGRLSQPQQEQYRLGARVAMGDRVNAAADTRNPYTSIYGSPTSRQRLETIYPQQAVNRFGQAYDMENQMAQTSQELLGGSPTAPRSMADAQFGEDLMGHAANALVDTMATGAPVRSLLQMGRQVIGDKMQLGMSLGAQRRADAILPDLLNTDPAAAQAMMNEAMTANGLNLGYRRNMRRVGGMMGYGAVGAAFPLLTQ